jgi:hypothetical protein
MTEQGAGNSRVLNRVGNKEIWVRISFAKAKQAGSIFYRIIIAYNSKTGHCLNFPLRRKIK